MPQVRSGADQEEAMSKQYEAAIKVLREFAGRAYENASEREVCESAIHVLEAIRKAISDYEEEK